MSAPYLDDDQVFYKPRDVAALTGLNYKTVMAGIHDGSIPAEQFGRIFKVRASWVRENRGDKAPMLQVVPDAAPPVAPDYGPLAAVLEIFGQAALDAAVALRGAP